MHLPSPLRVTALRSLRLACLWVALASASAPSLPASAAADAKALAQYDRNKNGKLDADERAAHRADEARAAAAVEKDEVVALSPFQVNAGSDKGYSTSGTLSGTRLASKLEDIAGSVSVITKQQLLDTAALDINDLFQYEVGTEGTKHFTDLTSDGRGDYDNVIGNPTGANRIRGFTAANITAGGFAASGSIPIDTCNIDAVEIVRGANSNLAGLSDAGGSVNLVTSRANLRRPSTNLSVRADSYGGFLGSLDFNRPLLRDLLSMRFSSVYEEKDFIRKPATDRTNRQQLAFTFRPFRTATITASAECYQQYASRANSLMPRENIS